MKEVFSKLMKLFEGFAGASGTHGVPEREGLKWIIKKTAKTLRVPVTSELWEQHVRGERPLGVIPIREDDSCSWGSIDVDEYDLDVVQALGRIEQSGYPLVPCRSKSGGLHLFLFLREPEPAADVQSALRDAAASLGMAECEIFPKQRNIVENSLGSWMVMPYFGSDYGGKLRMQHGLKRNGADMTMGEFVTHAEKKLTSTAELAEMCKTRRGEAGAGRKRKNGAARSSGDFSDGPPCLQHLTSLGVQSEGRKRTLFMMALYYKRAFPSDWKDKLSEANQKYFDPLPHDEVKGIVKSVTKKDYEYTCKEEPMRSCCDSMTCRARRYGVGKGGDLPNVTSLTMWNTQPPMWFVDLDGSRRVSVSTEELQIYQKFHRACMNQIQECYKTIKQDTWLTIVGDAMKNLVIEEAPPDIGEAGKFLELLEEFLTNRAIGDRREDLLEGRPWECVEESRYYFTLKSVEDFLKTKKNVLMRREIADYIEKLKGGRRLFNIHGKGCRTWYVPSGAVQKTPEIDPKRPESREFDA